MGAIPTLTGKQVILMMDILTLFLVVFAAMNFVVVFVFLIIMLIDRYKRK